MACPERQAASGGRGGSDPLQIGQVVGHAVATVKHPSLTGWRLLLVQPLTPDGKPDGEPLLAIDHLGAGPSARVILCNDGAEARSLVKDRNSPARWFVMGMVDQ
jgi:ethanolamine utilization protein EutN